MEGESYKMIYKARDKKNEYEKSLRIIGQNFYKHNKNKAKLIINNKKSNLKEHLKITNKNKEQIKIKIILNNNISNISYMFKGCISLLEFSMNNLIEYIDMDEYYTQMNFSDIEYNEINDTLWIEEKSEFSDLYF